MLYFPREYVDDGVKYSVSTAAAISTSIYLAFSSDEQHPARVSGGEQTQMSCREEATPRILERTLLPLVKTRGDDPGTGTEAASNLGCLAYLR